MNANAVPILFVVAILNLCNFNKQQIQTKMETKNEHIILAGGCFWCTEAIFQQLQGVIKVQSGYSGGNYENPDYDDVCSGITGHAEAVRIEYNPQAITLEEILLIFFKTHDPTTLNQQGADFGTQYRSAIFYFTEEQKNTALSMIEQLEQAKIWDKKIVTEVSPYKNFYLAEAYHQNYFNNNRFQGYCQIVIQPKLEKFKKEFKEKLVKH